MTRSIAHTEGAAADEQIKIKRFRCQLEVKAPVRKAVAFLEHLAGPTAGWGFAPGEPTLDIGWISFTEVEAEYVERITRAACDAAGWPVKSRIYTVYEEMPCL